MIQPDDIDVGASADLDAHGRLLRLSREGTHAWRLATFPDGLPSGLASAFIARVPNESRPWIVEPTSSTVIPEDFETWSAALQFAADLEAPMP